MGQAQPAPTRYTVEEYFALEEQSDVRHEFFRGEVFTMAGESKPHNTLSGNWYVALRQALRGTNCRVYMEGIRTVIQENMHYVYPDVVVSCHPDDQQDARLVRSPVLVVEVLSRSTEAYDRTHKFTRYKTLPSLRHYVLVSQRQWAVEWYRRNAADEWVHTALTEATEAIHIPELHLNLTLAEIYEESGVAPLRIVPNEPGVENLADPN